MNRERGAGDQIYLVPLDRSGKQTYKYATPRWVKSYVNRIVDDAYLNLTPIQRAALHGLEMIFALSQTGVPLDVKMLNRKLSLVTKLDTWKALNDAGFVGFVDAETALQSRGE